MTATPQFPLGTVLFPAMVLPLHVFELRYRSMIEKVLESEDRSFGVVLIERGSEVGGDDQRSDFGTLARVVDAEQFSDGRWTVVAVGTERFKVERWLPDDPYPIADIELWPDEPAVRDLGDDYERLVSTFRRCMALAAESGVDVGPIPDILDDAELGSMAMAAMAPVTALDKQRLLGAPGPGQRIELLDQMLNDALELIEVRLSGR